MANMQVKRDLDNDKIYVTIDVTSSPGKMGLLGYMIACLSIDKSYHDEARRSLQLLQEMKVLK